MRLPGHYRLDATARPDDYAGIEDHCTPKRCCAAELSITSIECCECKRRVCGSCAIKLGEDLYCPSCAKCGHLVSTEETDAFAGNRCSCKGLAVAWCTECGNLLCSEHSARLPDADLCVDCAGVKR